jgi:ankyrin repeat protein
MMGGLNLLAGCVLADNAPPFEKLSKQKRFEKITSILEDDTMNLLEWLQKGNGPATMPLHAILWHQPPVELVDLLIEKLTTLKPGYFPEAAVDDRGRTPLHIAAMSGCDFDVIERLSGGSQLAVVTKDESGRYPLHSACVKRHRSRKQNKSAILTVSLLVEIYPRATIVQDFNGQTPLDLAIQSNIDEKIVLTLTMTQQILNKSETDPHHGTASSTEASTLEVPTTVYRGKSLYADDLSSVGFRTFYPARKRKLFTTSHFLSI